MADSSSPMFREELARNQADYVGLTATTRNGVRNADFEDDMLHEVTDANTEIKTSPEATKAVLDSMDADTLLLREVIEHKRSWVGGIEEKIDEFSQKSAVNKGLTVVTKFGVRVLGSVVAHSAIGAGIKSVANVSNPVVSAVSGGLIGGFWGYLKGKKQAESLSSWASEAGVMDKDIKELTDPKKTSDEELEMALGILNNFIKDREGKVSGSAGQKLEIARRYRAIKNELKRRREGIKNKENLNPVMQRIAELSESAEVEGKAISEMAGERYRELYEQIRGHKNKKKWMSAIKGACIGAGLGYVANWLVDKFVHTGGAENASGNHVDQASADQSNGVDSILEAKKTSARDLHQNHMDYYNDTTGKVTLSPGDNVDTVKMAEHLDAVKGAGGTHHGFTETDLSGFNDSVEHANSAKELISSSNADLHNLDLRASIDSANGGESVGDFILQNKEQFLQLDSETQRQILSFPELADEILRSASEQTAHEATTVAASSVGNNILGTIGLAGFGAGIGGGFLGAHIAQKGADKEIRQDYGKAQEENKKEMNDWQVEYKQKKEDAEEEKKKKIEEHKEKSVNDLTGAEIVLLDPSKLDKKYKAKDVVFRIDKIENGKVIFVCTKDDVKKKKQFPTIKVDQLLDKEGYLDTSKVRILQEATGEEEESEEEEIVVDKKTYEKLKRETSLTGTVENFGSAGKVLVFSSPPYAQKLEGVKFKSSTDENIPTGTELDFKVKYINFDAGENPEVVVQATKEFDGENYRFEKYTKDKQSREQLVKDLFRFSDSGQSEKALIYIDTDKEFYKFIGYSEEHRNYKFTDRSGTDHYFDANDLKNRSIHYFVKE